MKRILSALLVMVMILTMIPIQAKAATGTPYLGFRWAGDDDSDGIHDLPAKSEAIEDGTLGGAPSQGSLMATETTSVLVLS